MKNLEKNKARKLRSDGLSIKDIAKTLNVSKGSVSNWVRDITLSKNQKNSLYKNMHSKQVIEKRRISRLKNELYKRNTIIEKEMLLFNKYLDKNLLFIIGPMLYWAEGGKKQRGIVRFSNSDPEMIKIMMRFFKEICKVPNKKFKGYVHTHSSSNVVAAENYWSKISGIKKDDFFKTYVKKSRLSKNKKQTLPFGTFEIYICDTALFLKIHAWTQAVIKKYTAVLPEGIEPPLEA